MRAHPASCGPDAFGLCLSSSMIGIARRENPGLRFAQGSMVDPDLPDGSLAITIPRYSGIRIPQEDLPALFSGSAGSRHPGDTGRRYGASSGDRNPIHPLPLTARLFGFSRTVAHGMGTVARRLAAHGLPEAVAGHVEFKAPALLPGAVTYGARDGRFEPRGPGDRLHPAGEVRPA